VRCKNFDPLLNVSPYEGLALRVKGNGLRYKCIIRTDTNWDGIGYCRYKQHMHRTYVRHNVSSLYCCCKYKQAHAQAVLYLIAGPVLLHVPHLQLA
jgi:hypothetical protein